MENYPLIILFTPSYLDHCLVCLCLTFQLNANAMHNALSPDTRPWVELGRSLGVAAATLGNNSKQGITVTAYG